jgi:hypothetical protein
VARFAIVINESKLLWTHALFRRFTIVARNLGRPFLGKKHQHVITEADSFSKNAVARSSTTSTTSSSAKKKSSNYSRFQL